MKYLSALLLSLTMVHIVAAQTADSGSTGNNTFIIKGKMLPWIMLGAGVNYTLGAEYGFNKVNGIGFELCYTDWSMEHEIYDTSTRDYIEGPRKFTVTRGALLYYTRYFPSRRSRAYKSLSGALKADYLPYMSIFARYGKLDWHYEDGYATNQLSYDEWQYSGGVVWGMVLGVFDLNIGPFYKVKYISDVRQGVQGTVEFHSKNVGGIGLRVGANIALVLKKSSHCRSVYYESGKQKTK